MAIKKLPETIVSRISAGEVVVSPYNVLKELMENSIDAGATSILVDLRSDLRSLTISDNGHGISLDDLQNLCLNHYTSKIETLQDLKRTGEISGLFSFGFRGEALHSISLVSHLKVETKPRTENNNTADSESRNRSITNGEVVEPSSLKVGDTHSNLLMKDEMCKNNTSKEDCLGYCAIYNGCDLIEVKKIAMDGYGTKVIVDDIFFNNSVRKDKFYKNKAECLNCVDLAKCYGCIYPGIAMKIDGRLVVQKDCSQKSISAVLSKKKRNSFKSTHSENFIVPHSADDNSVVCNEIKIEASAVLETHKTAEAIYANSYTKPQEKISYCNHADENTENERNNEHNYTIDQKSEMDYGDVSCMDNYSRELREIIENKIAFIVTSFLKPEDRSNLLYEIGDDFFVAFSNRYLGLKKYKFILFINNRLVKDESLRAKIAQKYRSRIGSSCVPFVYLEIFVDYVDANVHPSKSEVLVGDLGVFERVIQAIDQGLLGLNDSSIIEPYSKGVVTGQPPPFPSESHNGIEESNASCLSEELTGGREFKKRKMPINKEYFQSIADLNALEENEKTSDSGFYEKESSFLGSDLTRTIDSCHYERDIHQNISVKDDIPSIISGGAYPIKHVNSSFDDEYSVKIYSQPGIRTVEECTKVRPQKSKRYSLISLQKLESELVEEDDNFFKALTYVGQTSDFIFAQSFMNLIKISKQGFIKHHIYSMLIRNFGNIKTRPVEPVPTSIPESMYPLLFDYFGIKIIDGKIIEVPVFYGQVQNDWSNFDVKKTTEYETIKAAASEIAEIYKQIDIDSKIFNLIKTDVICTKEILGFCTNLVELKELYQKFGRC